MLQMKEERDKFKSTLHRIIHQSQHDDVHQNEVQNHFKSTKLYTVDAEQLVQRDLDLLDAEIGTCISFFTIFLSFNGILLYQLIR